MTTERMLLVVDRLIDERSPVVAAALAARVEELRTAVPEGVTFNERVFQVLQFAPSDDWGTWIAALNAAGTETTSSERIAELITRMIDEYGESGAALQNAIPGYVRDLIPFSREPLNSHADEIEPAIGRALGSAAWWRDDELMARRRDLADAIRAIGRVGGAPRSEELLGSDIGRAATVGTDMQERLAFIQSEAVDLPKAEVRKLAATVGTITTGQQLVDSAYVTVDAAEILLTRMTLARVYRAAGGEAQWRDPFAFTEEEVVGAAGAQSPTGTETLVQALLFHLPVSAVRRALQARDFSLSPQLADALRRWSGPLKRAERTNLVDHLILDDGATAEVIRVIAVHYDTPRLRCDERAVVQRSVKVLMNTRTVGERHDLAARIAGVEPRSGVGKKALAAAILALLGDERPKQDYEVALTLLMGLQSEHGLKRKLDDRFEEKQNSLNRKLVPAEIAAFERAGLNVPKKLIRVSFRDKLAGKSRSK